MLALDGAALAGERLLVLDQEEQQFVFDGIPQAPLHSLLRGFSAPVKLDDGLDDSQLLTLLAHDDDPFNRWDAAQRLMLSRLLAAMHSGQEPVLDDAMASALQAVLRHPGLAPAFKNSVLTPPSQAFVAEQLTAVDPQRVHVVHEQWRWQLARRLQADWLWAFDQHQVHEGYSPAAPQAGRRALAGLALQMLCLASAQSGDPVWPGRAYQRVKDASNMTDRLAAMNALLGCHSPLAEPALQHFRAAAQGDALVLDKWFGLQAMAPEPVPGLVAQAPGSAFQRAKALFQHPDFSIKNPNRVRSLLHALCGSNPAAFHRSDAAGYVLWADKLLELDALNAHVAGRFARTLDRWALLAEPYRSAAREAIVRVAAKPDLSGDVREVVARALEST